MDGIGIRPMSPTEIDAACAVIGLAFPDNPRSRVWMKRLGLPLVRGV
jgi:hypothetical protein